MTTTAPQPTSPTDCLHAHRIAKGVYALQHTCEPGVEWTTERIVLQGTAWTVTDERGRHVTPTPTLRDARIEAVDAFYNHHHPGATA